MTAGREAIALPLIFLTVLLMGGTRIAGTTALIQPTPYVLVLGVLLMRVLVQSHAFAPERFVSASRSTLANLNGIVALATLWLASAQTLAALTPDSGVPRLAVSVFFLMLLLNTAAASPDRERVLRSLAVTFGAAFIIKFVVLQAISAPGDAPVKRAVLALVDGVTAGALIQESTKPVTAYLAFAAVGLFLFGVFLLPHREISSERQLVRSIR